MIREYFVKFTCDYGILVSAPGHEDAILLVKAFAIDKGFRDQTGSNEPSNYYRKEHKKIGINSD